MLNRREAAEAPSRGVWNLIEPGIGTNYRRIFSGRDGSIMLLTVEP